MLQVGLLQPFSGAVSDPSTFKYQNLEQEGRPDVSQHGPTWLDCCMFRGDWHRPSARLTLVSESCDLLQYSLEFFKVTFLSLGQ